MRRRTGPTSAARRANLQRGGELRYSHVSTTLVASTEPSTVPLGGLQVTFGAGMLF
jgi:hypothetical protein